MVLKKKISDDPPQKFWHPWHSGDINNVNVDHGKSTQCPFMLSVKYEYSAFCICVRFLQPYRYKRNDVAAPLEIAEAA